MTTSKDYIVLETLHSGANGEVTVALSRKGKKVVLKKIDPNKVDKEFIYNEISIGRKMKHPNIVRMLSSWTETKFFFLEVEFIEVDFILVDDHVFSELNSCRDTIYSHSWNTETLCPCQRSNAASCFDNL